MEEIVTATPCEEFRRSCSNILREYGNVLGERWSNLME